MHRIVWDLRYPVPEALKDSRRRTAGLLAAPGKYVVRLTAKGVVLTRPLVVRRDPRVSVSEADLDRQLELARAIRAERVPLATEIRRADALSSQLAAPRAAKRPAAVASTAELDRFARRLAGVAGRSRSASEEGDDVPGTTLRSAAAWLQTLEDAVESADAAPTPDAVAGFPPRRAAAAAALAGWSAFLRDELPRVNAAMTAAGLRPLDPDSKEPVDDE